MSWIKMRTDLSTDPTVLRLCRVSGLDRFAVIGRLHALWAWFDAHSIDGKVDHVTKDDVAVVVGGMAFVDDLVRVSWLKVRGKCASIPSFERHNGESAKARSLKNQRQARWRDKKSVDAAPSTAASTRGEERRGDIKQALSTVAPVDKSETPGDRTHRPINGQNGKSKTHAWARTQSGIEAKGKELGVPTRIGELLDQYKDRVFQEVNRREKH